MDGRPVSGDARLGRRLGATLMVLVLCGALPVQAKLFGRKGPFQNGDLVKISGQVTDTAGMPLADVSVLLAVSRTAFKLRRLSRQTSDTLWVPTTTSADGSYLIDWSWDDYYNTFSLTVALPVRKGESEAYETFLQQDITEDVMRGNPVVVNLRLADASYLRWLQAFTANLASADERRIFGEMGRPDRVDNEERRGVKHSSWWYFAHGRVYRFADGKLEQVVPFDPIAPIE